MQDIMQKERTKQSLFTTRSNENRRSPSVSDITQMFFGKTSVLVVNALIGFALFGINVLFYLFSA